MSNLSELLPSGGGQNLVEFVASGTLPNGKPVILNSDGTVTVVGESSTTGIVIPSSSEVVFNSANSDYIRVAYDLNTAGKFVAVYRDVGNSNYPTAVVGTVSGTTISFGSEYVAMSTASLQLDVSFDPNTANKFVMAFSASYDGTVVVGTVSGTSISFGSATVFNSNQAKDCSVAFDPSTANKLVLTYRDHGNSSYGTAIVGTVSGTSISFGSEYVFNSTSTYSVDSNFDPNTANKFVAVYKDGGNSDYGTAIVGTVSGTSISFGSEYVFNSGESNLNRIAFDPNTTGKFVVTYRDDGNSLYGTALIGTVSGTTLSYGSEYVFNSAASYYLSASFDPNTAGKFVVAYQNTSSGSASAIIGTVSGTTISYSSPYVLNADNSQYTDLSFDPNTSGRFVVAYKDLGNSNYGTAILGDLSGTITTTNLTATNLIGISSASASSGGTAKINTWGGINEAQTSLVIASDYYVQADGTITTASSSPAVKVGQAISATTINMKDLT